jgi:hypothetical protein
MMQRHAFAPGRQLVPYASGEKKWPCAQIEAYNAADLTPALLRAAAHYI